MSASPLIVVQSLSKRYRIGKGLVNLREVFSLRGDRRSAQYHQALDDVNFSLGAGEALGIIGPNGAGKTTILKILSRVTYPTSGTVSVSGRLSALIELGAGFHPDLTGRENIFLNGTILGMRRAEIRARFDEIVAFAGIGDYLDTPVKRYSSGMYARLGFAIAAHVDPQVLLVDEVLAVGDYAFQLKCYARMDQLRRERGTALIFVSHNLEAVRRVCDRGLVMYRGKPVFLGSAADAVVAYSDAVRQGAKEARLGIPTEGGLSQQVMTFEAEVEDVAMVDCRGERRTSFATGEQATVRVDVVFHKAVQAPVFSLVVRALDGTVVYDTTTRWLGINTPDFEAGERCRVEFDLALRLVGGAYEVSVDIAAATFTHYYDRLDRALGFAVIGADGAKGLANLEARVAVRPLSQAAEAR